jgi:hypothetical protein
MLNAHADALVTARTALALLADHATGLEASSAYEQTLIQLDDIHADEVPALDAGAVTGDRQALCEMAASTIGELINHGVDELAVELVLAMLDRAHALDGE